MTPLKICYASAELAPFAKTGGLADVSSALCRFLHGAGHDVRPFLPLYAGIERASLGLEPVDNVRDVEIPLGERYRFSLLRARPEPAGPEIFFVHCPALYGRDALYTQDGDELETCALDAGVERQERPHVMAGAVQVAAQR